MGGSADSSGRNVPKKAGKNNNYDIFQVLSKFSWITFKTIFETLSALGRYQQKEEMPLVLVFVGQASYGRSARSIPTALERYFCYMIFMILIMCLQPRKS